MNVVCNVLLQLCCVGYCCAQLSVDTSNSIDYLVKEILLGPGVTVQNITYSGDKRAICLFQNDSTKLNFKKGILLSSGNVYSAFGPNIKTSSTTAYKTTGDEDLDDISTNKTFDAAVLEFDFVPTADSVSFNFIFASEEYIEYALTGFNDVFAFFISGPGFVEKQNIALIPGSNEPITINNINEYVNSDYYVDNNLWDRNGNRIPGKYNTTREFPYTLGFDGFTTSLKAESKLIADQRYHIKIAIADVRDRLMDSGVFLEARSFVSDSTTADTSKITKIAEVNLKEQTPQANSQTIKKFIKRIKKFGTDIEEAPVESSTVVYNPAPLILRGVHFVTGSAELTNKSLTILEVVFQSLKAYPDVNVEISGHTDNVGGYDFNIGLSRKRASRVKKYFEIRGIHPQRLQTTGYGYNKPIDSNETEEGRAANRRIEFSIVN